MTEFAALVGWKVHVLQNVKVEHYLR